MDHPFFSVIIPIYNREQYLDRSVNSLIDQEYQNWELHLVDDGSTDGSLDKCREIAKKHTDREIYIHHQENKGPGAARNLGISKSNGDYVLFLDSDDWLEKDCLNECAIAISQDSPDLVNFFMIEHYAQNSRINKRSLVPDGIPSESIKFFLMETDISVGTRAFRKSLIDEYDLSFPEWATSEDVCFTLMCYAVSGKVKQIKKAFYNYDKGTPISATKHGKNGLEYLFSIPSDIKNRLEQIGTYEKYETSIAKFFLTDVKYGLSITNKKDEYLTIKRMYKECVTEFFPRQYNAASSHFIVFGGYTLRSSVQSIALDIGEVKHFQFQSLISAMQKQRHPVTFECTNPYRKSMIDKELEGEFCQELIRDEYDYLVIDLLEERFDIIESNGMFITCSDAWKEGSSSLDNCKLISREDNISDDLFFASCRTLSEYISKKADMHRIILVKNYLMEYKGKWGQEQLHENVTEIRNKNHKLDGYYRYLEELIPNMIVVEPYRVIQGFSDMDYRHGCEPSHTCESIETYIGERILNVL